MKEIRFAEAITAAMTASERPASAAATIPSADSSRAAPVVKAGTSYLSSPMKTPLQAEEGNSMAIENPTTNSAICICGISEVGTLGKMMDKPNVAATRQ